MPSLRLPLIALLLVVAAPPALAQYGGERAGTAGFQSLQVPVDARGAALGQAAVAMADDASALFWNPALAARATDARPYAVGLATTRYHAETALHYAAGIARVGTPLGTFNLGLSVQAFDAGEMTETTELQPGGTGRTFGYAEWAAGVTVSQALTDLFSYGVTAKAVRLSTADLQAQTAVVDLGVFYRVGETGASLGVVIRNFAVADAIPSGNVQQIRPDGSIGAAEGFERITPPTQFLLGVSYSAIQTAQHALSVAAQLSNPADNQERFSLGAEYTWSQTVALRGGYQFGQDEGSLPTFGAGFFVPDFGGPALRVDYGFALRDRLGPVHRVGLDVRF
jgi:long-subunit fatty acid transport protein